ncbi:MAG: hypothetical protein KBS83_04360 [Lachnospiraceae bacterium]|nr:hypothetical protein [Candidatus Equihabitans merdae]
MYIVISLVLYITSTHVVSYMVTSGPLSSNKEYTALVIRSEEVITTDTGGYMTYYASENAKVRKTGSVYGLSQSPMTFEDAPMDEETLDGLKNSMRSFSGSFDPINFRETYNFKYKIKGDILSAYMKNIRQDDSSTAVTMGAQTIYVAPDDGTVVYSVDGYEDFDLTTMTADKLDRKTYAKTDLKTDESVAAGDAVYKLVTSDSWSIIIPLTSRQITDLDGRTSIRVKFLKDNNTAVGSLSIFKGADDQYYGNISFNNGMVRYINDRFLEIELVTNTRSGLKVPISSITHKQFYLIPETYATEGGDSNKIGFLKQQIDDEGNVSTVFTSTTLYEHKDGYYYVDTTEFSEGDVIIGGSDDDEYRIGEKANLEGVYSLNKGYAIFRKVIIMDKNEDYCIVEKGTPFGISQYDYIVLNASQVKEDEITYGNRG